jgi:hypothetical protein
MSAESFTGQRTRIVRNAPRTLAMRPMASGPEYYYQRFWPQGGLAGEDFDYVQPLSNPFDTALTGQFEIPYGPGMTHIRLYVETRGNFYAFNTPIEFRLTGVMSTAWTVGNNHGAAWPIADVTWFPGTGMVEAWMRGSYYDPDHPSWHVTGMVVAWMWLYISNEPL